MGDRPRTRRYSNDASRRSGERGAGDARRGRSGSSRASGKSTARASRVGYSPLETYEVRSLNPNWLMGAAIALVCAVVLVIAIVILANNGSRESSSGATPSETVENAVAQHALYDLNPADVLAIPDSEGVFMLDLSDGSTAPAGSDAALSDVRADIAAIEAEGDCGFVFLDVNTGHGVAYNPAEALYIASAAKAPLSFYAMTHGAASNDSHRASIEDAILYSDNDAFEAFAYDYTDEEYASWLESHEVYHEEYSYDLYPPMSARSLACIWAEICQYVEAGSADAAWFAELLGSTETSFIRDAVQDTGATVLNKGGWIADVGGDAYADEDDEAGEGSGFVPGTYFSVTDAGIVKADGRTYIMAIVTGQPDGGSAEANVTALAADLFALRADL